MTEKFKNVENSQNSSAVAEKPHDDLRTLVANAPYNSAKAISKLRECGYRVILRHLRCSAPSDPREQPVPLTTKAHIPIEHKILPTGGSTQLDITDPFGEHVTSGSVCSPKDNFWCEGGRYLALERAFEKLRQNQRSAQLLKKILKDAK
jgi:hypothetical protein